MQKLIMAMGKMIFFILKSLPIKEKQIVMECDYGKGFYNNLLYIYDELNQKHHNYTIIIPLNKGVQVNNDILIKKNTKIIKTKTLKHLYYLATSMYWITDNHYYYFLKPRKKTIFINTWHSLGGIKNIGIYSTSDNNVKKRYIEEGPRITWFLIGSEKNRERSIKSICLNEESIISIGIPRTDPFFNIQKQEELKASFLKKYPELKNKKIILYTPTFRDNQKEHFTIKLDLDKLKKRFSGEYVLIIKLHSIIRNKLVIPEEYNSFIYEMSNENINSLMFVSDLLITDYSSIFFEYALLKKPIIFYPYDYEEYTKEIRGFYFDYLSFVPGPIAWSSEDIVKMIENWDFDLESVEKFADEHCEFKDGKSSERFVKRFLLSN